MDLSNGEKWCAAAASAVDPLPPFKWRFPIARYGQSGPVCSRAEWKDVLIIAYILYGGSDRP